MSHSAKMPPPSVGKTLYLPTIREEHILPFRLVGIFKSPGANEPYWHGNDFLSVARGKPPFGPKGRIYMGLVSDEPFISIMTHITKNQGTGAVVLEIPFSLDWYYGFDPAHVSINDLATIVSNANTVQVDIANNPKLDQIPYLEKTQAFIPSDILDQYNNRIAIAQLPLISLLVLVM